MDLLTTPAFFVGTVLGFLLALLFHWLAPAGVDTAAAGAWFVGIGMTAGLLWSLVFSNRDKP